MLEGGKARAKGRAAPGGWIADATTSKMTEGVSPTGYGYFWWTGADDTYPAYGTSAS